MASGAEIRVRVMFSTQRRKDAKAQRYIKYLGLREDECILKRCRDVACYVSTILTMVALIMLPLNSYATSQAIYQFQTTAQSDQFRTLTDELRCLVCQNQNLAESNAPLAADLRQEIASKIKVGVSNDDIIHYLVLRYGNFILYKPPLNQTTWVLWFGPFILLVVGLMILILVIKRMQKL